MNFEELNLLPSLLRAIQEEGYTTPTPIQQQAIPHVLSGRDVLGVAQTGTGKTAAFALPILQRLSALPPRKDARPRVLVLSPTRELASQIGEGFAAYGRHLSIQGMVIFGGVGQEPQARGLRMGVDVVVATPGRLLDLMQQGLVRLDALQVLVLDEADRMLDMGFLPDVRRIVAAVPRERQTLLFSATMPSDIVSLARTMLIDPVRVEVTPVSSTVERIEQSVRFVEKNDKRAMLVEVLRDPAIQRVLVFTRTKHGANRLVEQLGRSSIMAAAIHGNKSQNARQRALDDFRDGNTRVLVTTDIFARGIDIDGITHVINYELPNVPETYVHRIGRTARAGADGVAISFCDREERPFLADIEKLIGRRVPRVDNAFVPSGAPLADVAPAAPAAAPRAAAHGGPSHGGPSHGGRGPQHSAPQGGSRGGQSDSRPQGGGQRGGAPQHGGRGPQQGGRGPQASAAGRGPDRSRPHNASGRALASAGGGRAQPARGERGRGVDARGGPAAGLVNGAEACNV